MSTSHHALLVTDQDVVSVALDEFYGDTEVRDQSFDKMGINDARELVRLSHNRPETTKELLFIVRTDFITHEAQNALLKVLEEPPVSTRFIFVLPPDFTLLPTLLSRFSRRSLSGTRTGIENTIFTSFLAGTYADRLSGIEQAAKKKDVDWQRQVKQGLISYIEKSPKDNESLLALEYAARLMLTRGASNKMLLEHAALTL